MKNWMIICLVAVIVLLAACAPEPPQVDGSFESKAVISGGGFDCEADVSVSPGKTVITLTSPQSAGGITYEYDGRELITSLNGLSCITEGMTLPDSSPIALLCKAMDKLDKAEFEGSQDERDRYIIPLDGKKATLICTDGTPESLTADGIGYTFRFNGS